MTATHTQGLYEKHHRANRSEGFSILKDTRGKCFSTLIGEGKRVLDLGCRDGALTASFVANNTVLGVDIDTDALVRAQEIGIETRQMDIMGDWHELQGETFDVIVAGELLEHLFFPDETVKKVAAHLRPRGTFIGSVPNAFSLKNRIRYLMGTKKGTPLADPTHINQFSVEDFSALLRQTFSSVEIYGLGRYARLASFSPNWFAFDIAFKASNVVSDKETRI